MVKPGAVIVDVGIHRIPDDSKKSGYRLIGDVDYGPVSEKSEAISPVPGRSWANDYRLFAQEYLASSQRTLRIFLQKRFYIFKRLMGNNNHKI